METLQSTIFIEFDVNTKKIAFLRGDGIIDYDSNTTSVYVRVKYKNLSGNTVYLTPSELEDYKFSLYTIKPATNNVNVITGKVTDELKENVYGGVVKFEIPRVCTNRLGIVKCEIHINQENKIIGSSTFILDVKQSLVTAFDDELLGDEDFPVLKQLILEIQKASNIDDNNRSKITTYSSDKIEGIKETLTSQIECKVSKGEGGVITNAMLSQEVKESMTGGSVAVVGKDSILTENIVDGQVTLDKVNFKPICNGVLGKNLFNKDDIELNKFISPEDGIIFTSEDERFVSGYIPVNAGETYTINKINQGAYFDENKKYYNDDTLNFFPEISKTITIPAGVSYIRFSTKTDYLNIIQFEKGSIATAYEPYGYVNADNSIDGSALKDNSITTDKYKDNSITTDKVAFNTISFYKSKNLFNKNDIKTGYYVSYVNGEIQTNSDYSVSGFIKIEAGSTYTINYFDQVAYYNNDKIFVSGVDGFQLGVKTITIPDGVEYIRVSVRNSVLDKYQLEKGDKATDYENFGVYITEDAFSNDLKEKCFKKITIDSIMSKLVLSDSTINIKLLGDSITHGQGGSNFEQDGDLIWDAGWCSWRVNTNGYCWANKLKTYFESKFNCTVKNYGMAGTSSWHLNEAYSNLVEADDDIIIVMIGTNNRNSGGVISSTTQKLYNDLKEFYNHVVEDGKQVIFMSSIPASVENETDNKLFHMEDVDHIYMKLANDLNIEYISMFKLFNEYCNSRGINLNSLLADGLHPNDTGYDAMFYLITNALGLSPKINGATW